MAELAVSPYESKHLVVVGSSLRKPANILDAYLQSLAWQVIPPRVELVYLFVDDGLTPDARAVVDAFMVGREGQVIPGIPALAEDFSDVHPESHQWSDTAMARVGRNKDLILRAAQENRAEACWFVDADLIMDPMTLTDLWSIPDLIVCAAYWTRWQKTRPEENPVHAGPQVWMAHPYILSGGGLDEWELRKKLVDRQVVHVFGQGACTLIRRAALEKGVSFAPWPANTAPGLMQGEDRHFCIRAEALHLKQVATGWPDIFHIYHRPEDEALIPEMLQRLSLTYAGRLDVGDLISLELQALEPMATPIGLRYPPIQQVRGRLGKLPLHPELEQAVLGMVRGEKRVVPVHFGLHYPVPPYQGQRRLIQVTLIDYKPFGFPPVIDTEIVQNDLGSWTDTTQLTPELVEQLREVHG